MSAEPLDDTAIVTQRYAVAQGEERAVVIAVRDYDRLIERLEGCKPGGWADLWLACVGGAVAVAIGALVGALTLPASMSGTRDALWAITGGGVVALLLCLLGYFTQRRDHGGEIAELRKDLENHKPIARASRPGPPAINARTAPPASTVAPRPRRPPCGQTHQRQSRSR